MLAVLAVDEDSDLNGRVVYELVPSDSVLQHFYLQNKGKAGDVSHKKPAILFRGGTLVYCNGNEFGAPPNFHPPCTAIPQFYA